ncbi:MAG: response regulator [Patescibacteria group bacterium]|jgi:DNA-binding response OmpR family regulator|nr:response regulator [Patescibacteria group bacterium]
MKNTLPKKIVIIEDDPSISQMYKFKLDLEGYNVTLAHNSWEGLELIKKIKPDLVLLDVLMPYERGEDMLIKLRTTPYGKNLRVMMLTNTEYQDASPIITKLGVRNYIIKANTTPKQLVRLARKELNDKPEKSIART